MTEGLFDGLDLENAADNPFEIPDDKYGLILTDVIPKPDHEVKSGTHKGTKKNMLVLEYTINEGEAQTAIGQKQQMWFTKPSPGDTSKAAETAKSYLKQHLTKIGIPESKMNSVTREDLLGIEIYATLKAKDGYTNIVQGSVELKGGSSSASSGEFSGF